MADVQMQKKCRVRDVGRVVTGKTPATAIQENFGDDFPFLTPTDMHGSKWARATERGLSRKGAATLRGQIPAGSVAVSCIGWQMGKAILIDRPTYTNQQINSIIPHDDVDAQYLYYYFATRRNELLSIGAAGGVRTPIISKSLFEGIEIELPEYRVQRHIASILSAYDDLIENNTRRIAILEEMARRLYEEWFVRFRFPGHVGVPMVASELGLVPQGWGLKKVDDIVLRLPSGVVYKQADVSAEGTVPVIDQSTSELLGFHDDVPAHKASADAPVIIFGDHTCKMQLMVTPFSLGPNTVPFMAKELAVHYVFWVVRGLIKTQEYKRHWSDLMKKSVIVAPVSIAQLFAEQVQSMAKFAELLKRKNRNLRTTRDLLLPKLISGELDVSALLEPQAKTA